jgi:hypothetical protein
MDEQGRSWFDKPANVKKLLRGLYAICTTLVVLDFVIHRHTVLRVEHVWGFYAIYGFVACVSLVLTATQMRKVLLRDEDYYDGE